MSIEQERARRALDLQARAKDVPLSQIPAYKKWSERQLESGTSDALIAHLDATSMWLLPEEVAKVSEADFDEMLQDLMDEIGEG